MIHRKKLDVSILESFYKEEQANNYVQQLYQESDGEHDYSYHHSYLNSKEWKGYVHEMDEE